MELKLIQQNIFDIGGQKVMLDYDLAKLYEVETRTLNQAIKRNLEVFLLILCSGLQWRNGLKFHHHKL